MKKSIVAIIIVGILIIAGIVYFALNKEAFTSEEPLEAIITVDKQIIRISGSINFSAEDSTGDIKGYHWDFGDGKTANYKTTSHIYSTSGSFNVTLTIKGKDKGEDNVSIEIKVQPQDITQTSDGGRYFEYRQDSLSHSGTGIEIEPYGATPRIEATLTVFNAMGEVGVFIDINGWGEGEPQSFEETRQTSGQDITFDLTILPDEIDVVILEIDAGVVLIGQGGYNGYDITINVIFPL